MKDSRSTPRRQQKQTQQQQQPSQKRALPPRHSFLTEAVQTALERQSTKYEPHIDANTILCISSNDNDDFFNQVEEVQDNSNLDQQVPEHYQEPTMKPVFTVSDKPPRRPRKRSQPNVPINEIELIPEEYYLKRHRKHEKEEKKQKNREKERLQHEMYQQQQFVERVRHTDKSIIMAIASALKQQQEAENTSTPVDGDSAEAASGATAATTQPAPSSSSTLPDVDVLYRQVLHDAEEHLRRYEMLGLTRKSRKEEYKSPPVVSEVSTPAPASPPGSPSAPAHQQPSSTSTTTATPATTSKASTTIPATATATTTTTTTTTTNNSTASSLTKHNSSIASTSSLSSAASASTSSNKASKKKASTTTIPKSFKSFYKPNTLSEPPKGSRRSARNILAFGHRIAPMSECDFHLPMDEYGEQMEERAQVLWKRHKKQ